MVYIIMLEYSLMKHLQGFGVAVVVLLLHYFAIGLEFPTFQASWSKMSSVYFKYKWCMEMHSQV